MGGAGSSALGLGALTLGFGDLSSFGMSKLQVFSYLGTMSSNKVDLIQARVSFPCPQRPVLVSGPPFGDIVSDHLVGESS